MYLVSTDHHRYTGLLLAFPEILSQVVRILTDRFTNIEAFKTATAHTAMSAKENMMAQQ
jgi:hypothetical protein